MTRSQRLALIAAVILFAQMSLARTCSAGPVYGIWTGLETYSIEYFVTYGQIISQYSGAAYPTTLSVEFDPCNDPPNEGWAEMSIGSGPTGFSVGGPVTFGGYGPQSAEYSMIDTSYPEGYVAGDFDVTFPSILPGGCIDATDGYAVADITYDNYLGGSQGLYEFAFITFQTIPEPSSRVLAAAGAVTIVLFARMRRFSVAASVSTMRVSSDRRTETAPTNSRTNVPRSSGRGFRLAR